MKPSVQPPKLVEALKLTSELGKKVIYRSHYDQSLLLAIPRLEQRQTIGIENQLPFFGFDLWNHYEVSWLNEKGKPLVALATICYGCETPNIIESKSMKLYFNSLNNTQFKSVASLQEIIKKDLEHCVNGTVDVLIRPLNMLKDSPLFVGSEGTCLDELDIECTTYTVDKSFLTTDNTIVNENLYSNLLKSNCLVTQQPDWGSVEISYAGKKINHAGLLRYIISFRNHHEFHEHCIERIFTDIMQQCQPTELTVYGKYTRRGGLDINPCRSTQKVTPITPDKRLIRQ